MCQLYVLAISDLFGSYWFLLDLYSPCLDIGESPASCLEFPLILLNLADQYTMSERNAIITHNSRKAQSGIASGLKKRERGTGIPSRIPN